jgi:hypothetical protein
MARVFKVDGSEQDLGQEPSLEQLQAAVGGYIETVRIPVSDRVMVVNEEGRLRNLHLNLNPKASLMVRKTIVGDVVVCTQTIDGRLL